MFNFITNRSALLLVAPVLVALLCATRFAGPPSARPPNHSPVGNCSITGVLAQYADWVNLTPTGGTNVVRVSLTSNQNNRLVSYAEGILEKTSGPFPNGPNNPNAPQGVGLGGTLKQYFSDRKYTFPAGHGSLSLDPHPFSPQHTDQLYLGLYTSTGRITLRLVSWGDTDLILTGVECAGGVLYGFTNTNPSTMFVISLSIDFKATLPNPNR
jgi:hypothetical protein